MYRSYSYVIMTPPLRQQRAPNPILVLLWISLLIFATNTSTSTSTSKCTGLVQSISSATTLRTRQEHHGIITSMATSTAMSTAMAMSMSMSMSTRKTTPEHNQQSVQEDADNRSVIQKQNKYKKELFSVAPMMAHTNRHYRFFWRLFSSHAFLYTEMIPAGQIVSAFDRELKYMGKDNDKYRDNQQQSSKQVVNSDQILEVVRQISNNQSSSSSSSSLGIGGKDVNSQGNIESLNELLRFSEQTKTGIFANKGQTTLQIGGCDPYLLAKASAIGAAFGYSSINLNCGCPSSAVSGRAGGVSHMKDPMHVAKCVEAMNQAVTDLYHSDSIDSMTTKDNDNDNNCHVSPIPISVKHRLGVRDAASYNAQEDQLKNDEEEAFPTCREFVKAITFSGDVSKVQVHARLGLLGDFDASDASATTASTTSASSASSTLWVPGGASVNQNQNTSARNEGLQAKDKSKSIDHKRVQYQAKQRARQATIHNRSIPPLRPNVVDLLADEFPNLEFVANGGIHSMASVQDRLSKGSSSVVGAMVGRAAINHPCSFALADSLWDDNDDDDASATVTVLPSRGDVLLAYIDYCDEEEQRVSALGVSIGSLAALRRRLAAVPFHLFVGEECNNLYQRRIRKLVSRAERHSAKSMLMSALYEMPAESINKSVGDFTSVEEQKVHAQAVERSGPLQKSIY